MRSSGSSFTSLGIHKSTDGVGWVKDWLEEIEEHDSSEKSDLNGGIPPKKDTHTPVTPLRPLVLQQTYNEVSPTNTSFSGESVFDTPYRGRHEPGSPCPCGRFRENVSAASSVTEEDEECDLPSKLRANQLPAPRFAPGPLQPASLNSYEPLSESEDTAVDETEILVVIPKTYSPPRDPNEPRFVNLVSCLQCTLAGLPCSRKSPSCSRCKRNRSDKVCLLYRRRFHEEVDRSNPHVCTDPVLLKLKGEDDEGWQTKLELSESLHKQWAENQDKKNWVLPPIESSKRVDFHVTGYLRPKMHPGEGLGRAAYKEVFVDPETILG